MKNVILSHDSDLLVYSVPDIVADQLDKYCWEFAAEWLWHSPDAQKYHRVVNGIDVVYYGVPDFIDYLNTYVFPHEKSTLVINLGLVDVNNKIPEEYKECSKYNF